MAAPSYDDDAKKALPADVRMFSGCKDSQTSADVSNVSSFKLPAKAGPGGAGGACTNALLANVYNASTDISWIGLIKAMQKTLKTKGYTQIPQFSGSRPNNLKEKFTIVNKEKGPSSTMKSLFVGINYVGQDGELRGCHNDVLSMLKLLEKFGFSSDPSAQRIMMDDGRHINPTAANIREGMKWLVAGAKPGDTLFMHYSGHGASIKDDDGDEKDGKDEALVPVDFKRGGLIRDDEILSELVLTLPEGVMLTVLMDCCHSGSIMDLPYTFTGTSENVTAVETGTAPAVMAPTPGFNMGTLMALGQKVLGSVMAGGGAAGAVSVMKREGVGMGMQAATGVAQKKGCCTIM